MDFARFLESVTKPQSACISIDNNRYRWAQAITVAQTFFNARIEPVQIIDYLPNSMTLHGKQTLTVRKMAQQGGNSNDWQTIILRAIRVLR
jgi:hypothetical protein